MDVDDWRTPLEYSDNVIIKSNRCGDPLSWVWQPGNSNRKIALGHYNNQLPVDYQTNSDTNGVALLVNTANYNIGTDYGPCVLGDTNNVIKAISGTVLSVSNAYTCNLNPANPPQTDWPYPTNPNKVTWNSFSGSGSFTLGANMNWAALILQNPPGAITINGPQTLTLGAGGINLSNATVNLTLNHPAVLAANQAWTITNNQVLTANGVISGAGNLTVNGAGTLVFAAANNYSGATTVNAGKLVVSSAQDTTNTITIAAKAAFGVTVAGTNQFSPKTINLAATTTIEFTGVTNTTLAPINAGILAVNGPVAINILSGTFASGQSYPLIHFSSISGSGGFNLGLLPAGVVAAFATNGNNIVLNVSAATAVTWTGSVNGSWDTTTLNWNNSGGATTYVNGGVAQFDDTATGSTFVSNTVTVAPGTIFVTNSLKNYTFTGNSISGGGSLTKSGPGTLTINITNNTYTGGTFVNAGVVNLIDNISSAHNINTGLGLGNITVASGANLLFSDANYHTCTNTITINGTGNSNPGALRFGNSNWTLTGALTLGSDASISGLANTMSGVINLGSCILTDAKNSGVSETWSAIISGTGGLTQAGVGGTTTLTLTGANTYIGATTVSNGVLLVNGALAASPVMVMSGATLGGSGVITGSVTVALGGLLQPGAGGTGIATLTISSNLTLFGNVLLVLNRTNTQSTTAITGLSTVNYGGTMTVTNVGPALQAGDSFTLLQAISSSGTFDVTNLPALTNGLAWTWTPASGTLSVASAIAATPTNLSYQVSGNLLTLTWPGSHLGWLAQSNSVNLANPNGWFDITNSQFATNLNITINPAWTNVFYRLRHP